MKRTISLLIAALFLVIPGLMAPSAAHAATGDVEVFPVTKRPMYYQLSTDGNTAYVTFDHSPCERDFAGTITRVGYRPTVKITGNVYGKFCVPSVVLTALALDARGISVRYFGLYTTDGARVPFQGYRTSTQA